MTHPSTDSPLSAEEEAQVRQRKRIGAHTVPRVWATLDAARRQHIEDVNRAYDEGIVAAHPESQPDPGELREALIAFAEERLTAWAGCVQRLVKVAPTSAVMDETGARFSGGGHSTPPERKAIREAAAKVVAGWLARDLAALESPREER